MRRAWEQASSCLWEKRDAGASCWRARRAETPGWAACREVDGQGNLDSDLKASSYMAVIAFVH